MGQRLSVNKAIIIGTIWVNGPVVTLLLGPMLLFTVYRSDQGPLAEAGIWIRVVVVSVCLLAAWLWWAMTIPKWRLWAYESVGVDHIPQLKMQAIAAGLTWPAHSWLTRHEIKSKAHASRERELEA